MEGGVEPPLEGGVAGGVEGGLEERLVLQGTFGKTLAMGSVLCSKSCCIIPHTCAHYRNPSRETSLP